MKDGLEQSQGKPAVASTNWAGRPHPGTGNVMLWVRVSLVLFAIGFSYFYRIDRPLLWGDEAETGIAARNTLHFGFPTAFDGRNLTLYEGGAQLNKGLLFRRIPWVQYYVGALSVAVFGDSTAGLRLLFALIGLLAFFPIYAVLRRRIKYPDVVAALALLSPQIVLFQRNARYYSILVLLYAILVWHLSTEFKSAKARIGIASLVLVLLFHTHPLVAVCCCLSLILFCLLFRRKALSAYSLSSCIGFLSWLAWTQLLGPPLAEKALPLSTVTSNFSAWLGSFCAGFVAAIIDLDVVGCFPILLWTAAILLLFLRKRKEALGILREPLPAFVLLNIVISAAAAAAVFHYETTAHYSLLRYIPHLLVFAVISCFVLLDAIISAKSLYLAACAFAVAVNLPTFSFWAKPYSRTVPISWVPPVYSETLRPHENHWDVLMAKMRSEAQSASDHDKAIVALPPWTQEILIFYLGDFYLVRPVLNGPLADIERPLREAMGEGRYRRLFARPEWIVDMFGLLETVPDGYVIAGTLPVHQPRPDDGARPELTRHSFFKPSIVGYIRILRLEREGVAVDAIPR